jgi:hypothetical protein
MAQECGFGGCARSWCHIASDVNRAAVLPAPRPTPNHIGSYTWQINWADRQRSKQLPLDVRYEAPLHQLNSVFVACEMVE